jgi:uncharacterized protein (AIM24 family)
VSATAGSYTCRYCRLQSVPTGTSCPNCGAPVDVRAIEVSDSGWVEQPPVQDMAKIQFGQSTCQIEGTLVPAADFGLAANDGVYFSHHSLLWADPAVRLEASGMGGGFKRMLAGMPLILMHASGPGHLALSEDHPGEVVALPIPPGVGFYVREHAFFAAHDSVTYRPEQSSLWLQVQEGDETEYEYPCGMYVDLFMTQDRPGLLLLHAPGNLFIRDLAPGQSILVQPTAWVYSDVGVGASLHIEYPATGGSGWKGYRRAFDYRTVWLRLTGPGRVAVRSVFERPERVGPIVNSGAAMTIGRW